MDDGRWSVTLPFTVYLFGTAYTTAWMCTNGWLALGADPGANNYSNTTLPDGVAPHQAIYGFWDDLVYDEAEWTDTAMVWQVSGSAPNRMLTFEWKSLRYLGTGGAHSHRVSWQIKLYETTRVVEILYDRSSFLGATYSATVGIEDQAQAAGITVGNGLTSPPAQDVRFTPN
jgi:hypothetical protein